MFVMGFALAAVISLASFFAILAFASPQASPTIIALFFLTLFSSVSSIAVLGHFFIFRLKGWKVQEHKELLPIIFRRGIFLGGFATLLFIIEAMRRLTSLTGLALLILFVGVEIFVTRKENSSLQQ